MSAKAGAVPRARVGHHVGREDEFELDRFRLFELEGRPVGVVRTADGFFAVRNRCPHQGAEICAGLISGTMAATGPREYVYRDERRVLACPWHRWEFDMETGASVAGITKKRLVTYPVDVEDGQVIVSMPARGGKERG